MAALAVGMMAGREDNLLPVGVDGFLGGLGVALSVAIRRRRFLTHPYPFVFGAPVVGCVAALPFGLWLRSYHANPSPWFDPLQPLRLRYAFAIWQAAVGTYLYAVCTWGKEKAPQPD